MSKPYLTVVETPGYLDDIETLLSEEEAEQLVFYLAVNPEGGDIMPGGGGIRKLRWAAKGKGKRAGARVIYYHYDDDIPVFVLAAYGKNEKINLTEKEKRYLKQQLGQLVNHYKRKAG